MSKFILDMSLCENLKYYRKLKGYTQMDVVREANLYGSTMSESTYSKIEQGNRNIFISDFIILKLVLGFTYDELFQNLENIITLQVEKHE